MSYLQSLEYHSAIIAPTCLGRVWKGHEMLHCYARSPSSSESSWTKSSGNARKRCTTGLSTSTSCNRQWEWSWTDSVGGGYSLGGSRAWWSSPQIKVPSVTGFKVGCECEPRGADLGTNLLPGKNWRVISCSSLRKTWTMFEHQSVCFLQHPFAPTIWIVQGRFQ